MPIEPHPTDPELVVMRSHKFNLQKPWVGLTEEEVRFYTEKHRALVNAHYDKVADTNIMTEKFDSTAFYKDVSAVLKERNT